MNIDAMYELFFDIQEEMIPDRLSLFNSLVQKLGSQSTNPTNQQVQLQVKEARKELLSSLKEAKSNLYNQMQKKMLKELFLDECLGVQLVDRIETIFIKNGYAPAIIAEEMKDLYAEVDEKIDYLKQITSSLEGLEIEGSKLKPGECEFSFSIPKDLTKNGVIGLCSELEEIEKMYRPFEELTQKSSSGLKVYSVASSEFEFFCLTLPIVAKTMAESISVIIYAFEKMSKFKRDIEKFIDEHSASKKSVANLEKDASDVMLKAIDVVAPQLIEKYYKGDEGTGNELEGKLKYSMKIMATKIECGFHFSVRGLPPKLDEEEKDGKKIKLVKEIEQINKIAGSKKLLNPGKYPILELTETKDEQKKSKKADSKKTKKPSKKKK